MSEATQQLPDTVAAIVDKHLKLWHALWVPCFTNADDLQPTVFRITVECPGQTGVEMEALTACSVALPKIYDM